MPSCSLFLRCSPKVVDTIDSAFLLESRSGRMNPIMESMGSSSSLISMTCGVLVVRYSSCRGAWPRVS